MANKFRILLGVTVAGLAAAPSLATVTLQGDYIHTTVNDRGVLGNGSGTPGLIHDPTGTGTFNPNNDYIRPGTPHEGFAIVSDQFTLRENSNRGVTQISGGVASLLLGPAAMGFDNAATWKGSNAFLTITNNYFFNDGDERILINTSITALQDLTNLQFVRSVDPDPDQLTSGSFNTNNQRGNSLFGVTDFAGSEGPVTGLTLALINLSGNTYAHNTRIDLACCNAPSPSTVLLGGPNNTTGDFSLNLAYNLGNLASGSTLGLSYAYAVGDEIETVGAAVPEPSTWAMLILGFGMVGMTMRRRRVSVSYA